MRIIFMGTPKPAADILESLVKAGKDIIAVITQPDKPKGRGLKTAQCDASSAAAGHSLPVLKPSAIKDTAFLQSISELKPDLIVIVAYGKILPKALLDIPKFGCINVHASYLPKYRGASPIQTALLNGDKETGVSIFRLDEKMDEGDILAQEKVMIKEEDDAQKLSDKLFDVGGRLLLKVLGAYCNTPVPIGSKQNDDEATYCRIIKKGDGAIDFNSSAEEIHNMIRALTPWPGASAEFKGKKVKILRARAVPDLGKEAAHGEITSIVKGEGFVISANGGGLLVTGIQPENSKPMTAEAFINGYRVEPGDRFNY